MGYSKSTKHFDLPQFQANDRPTWLKDINDAFKTIDSALYQAIKENPDSASNLAVVQGIGDSVEDVMSQKAVTQALGKKQNTLEIVENVNEGGQNNIISGSGVKASVQRLDERISTLPLPFNMYQSAFNIATNNGCSVAYRAFRIAEKFIFIQLTCGIESGVGINLVEIPIDLFNNVDPYNNEHLPRIHTMDSNNDLSSCEVGIYPAESGLNISFQIFKPVNAGQSGSASFIITLT